MPLLLTGREFRQDLERAGALALYVPLEGGSETRLLRRLRAAGYQAQMLSARGLGEVQRAAPLLGPQFAGEGPVLLWLLEGQVLSSAELASLCNLCRREPRLRIVVEMGGARALRWQPLNTLLAV